jgi:hypothetical protein
MSKLMEYRQRSEECRVRASEVAKEEERLFLLDLAKRWTTLAEEREKLVREHPDLFPAEASVMSSGRAGTLRATR